jgi:hypothetical protein
MNIPLLILNITFYTIILILYEEAQRDPSASLGIGFAFMFIFILFPVLQFILWRVKIIRVKTIVDKIGMLTATPLIPIVVFSIASRVNAGKTTSSTAEYNANNHRYRMEYYAFSKIPKTRKIAFYKSVDTVSETSPYPETDEWVKDSIWLYFSESGDTIRKEIYRNDTLKEVIKM